MGLLTDDEIAGALQALPGWQRDGDAIVKTFDLGSFPSALAFVLRVAFGAEAADHHPDITVSYKRVTLRYSTHSAGGLTRKDVDGAHAVEDLGIT